MHRAISLIFIFLISLSLIAESVKADQVVYLSFEGFSIYHVTINQGRTLPSDAIQTTYYEVASWVLSLSNPKYLGGMRIYIYWSRSNRAYTQYARITISDGVNSYTETVTLYSTRTSDSGVQGRNYFDIIPSGLDASTQFTITVEVSSNQDAENPYAEVIEAWHHVIAEQTGGIKSHLTELRYIPPGADNTATGFILNQTEVYLSQTYTLNEGSISFWLKWDGSTNITISDNIGIDTNGYIYVKNDAETTYTLGGVSPPIGVYVPVYISWRSGEGYIMINTTKVTLNWDGNLIISRIGDIGRSSATIIDEFKLWDTYIPPDQVLYESQKEQYTLYGTAIAIAIKPEGGTSLGMIDVAFLDANLTTINSTTLSPGQKTATVPNGTAIITLSRGGVSRTYYLDNNINSIAFPAEGVTIIVSEVQVKPYPYDYLTLKTMGGDIAGRIKLDGIEKITAVYGNTYIFTFERDSEVRSRMYTVSESQIIFYISETGELNPPIDVSAYYQDGLVRVNYYDANYQTSSINVTVIGYRNFATAWKVSDAEVGSFGLYTFTANANDTEYAEVTITANISGTLQTFKRTIYISPNTQRYPFPTELVPPALILLATALVGMFVFPGKAPHLMLLGGAISLGLLSLLGWVPEAGELILVLTILGVLALVVYRRG